MAAARAAASAQHYPQGALYVVATPIGNLADITLRALHVLDMADTVACEDTRHTQQLLRSYGIEKAASQLIALHQHNEAQAAQTVVQRLQAGQRVAYVSDAGTPGISDPGARLVTAARAQGLRCIPLPGASSVTALLSVAGNADSVGDVTGSAAGFVFLGFLPSKAQECAHAVAQLAQHTRPVVLLEAPHRIVATARALQVLGERCVTVGRELTKQFEELATVQAQALPAWFAENEKRRKGEFALVVHPAGKTAESAGLEDAQALRTLQRLMAVLPLKTAVQLTAEITGLSRNVLYAQALALKNTGAHTDAPEAAD